MSDQNAGGGGQQGMYQQQGYCCSGCGRWVTPSFTPHVCVTTWPVPQPPSPLFPDPRLLALQEQIAKALERIADALEGKKPL